MITYIEGVLAQLLVKVTLLLSHVGIQDQLLLARQAVLHITLHTSQQERLQDGVQLGDDLHVDHNSAICVGKTHRTCVQSTLCLQT